MKKRGLLKVLGITLFLFTIFFFVANKTSFGIMTQATIAFLNINKSIPDANYLQWEIESSYDFGVSVWIEDIHGNNVTISFGPNNENNSWDYEVDEEVDYLMVAFPVNNRIYEPDSFEDLITLFLSEDDESTFLWLEPNLLRVPATLLSLLGSTVLQSLCVSLGESAALWVAASASLVLSAAYSC